MGQPSQHIADRYSVELTGHWRSWFDYDAGNVPLAGEFREASRNDLLLDHAPAIIWPGLMLPDTLPLIGNEYGDWICVRVEADNNLGELVHWYHGGGDWIPLGRNIAEAALHDAVDQFRPRVGQVLRGAAESTSLDNVDEVVKRLNDPKWQRWIADSLGNSSGGDSSLNNVFEALSIRDYLSAIRYLEQAGWANEVTQCDQIEYALQLPVRSLASDEISRRLGMNWEPDYVRWLFDLRQIPNEAMHQLQEILHSLGQPPAQPNSQNWAEAERLAKGVLSRRWDLAWAVDIAGWAAQRRGDLADACEIYFKGRFASAFSNQSVRMRSHWFDPQFGKVALAEMWNLREQLNSCQRDDSYVQKVWQTPTRLLQREVQEFWSSAGRIAMYDGEFASAYKCFFRAGWDIGAQRMTDYLDILGRLIESAEAAGWKARAAVAATHLACLSKLLPPNR